VRRLYAVAEAGGLAGAQAPAKKFFPASFFVKYLKF